MEYKTNALFYLSEEAAADEKKGKLYKPKSRFENQPKSFLPLETPTQFLPIDKRHVRDRCQQGASPVNVVVNDA